MATEEEYKNLARLYIHPQPENRRIANEIMDSGEYKENALAHFICKQLVKNFVIPQNLPEDHREIKKGTIHCGTIDSEDGSAFGAEFRVIYQIRRGRRFRDSLEIYFELTPFWSLVRHTLCTPKLNTDLILLTFDYKWSLYFPEKGEAHEPFEDLKNKFKAVCYNPIFKNVIRDKLITLHARN